MSGTPKFDTSKVESIFERAYELASVNNHQYIIIDHLLYSITEDDNSAEIFEKFGIDRKILQDELATYLASGVVPQVLGMSPIETRTFQRMKNRAITQAFFSGRREIVPNDFLLSILEEADSNASYLLQKYGITTLKLKHALTEDLHDSMDDEDDSDDDDDRPTMMPGMPSKKKGPMDEKKALKILKKFCVNLNQEATDGKIDNLIGREEAVFKLAKITARRKKNNAIMIGDPGVGKTAIVEGLAKLIVDKKAPEVLLDSTIWSLDVTALLAGTKFRGDFEERLKDVLEAMKFVKNPIVFIDEIHTIIGAGGGGSSGGADAANILKPALAAGKLRCIGSTTFEEYRKYFEKDRALIRRFQRIDIAEPSVEDSKKILRGLRAYYEEYHGITYTDKALDAAVDLSKRYITDRLLPDKAIDLIDNAGAHQRVIDSKERVAVVDVENIEFEVSKIARIPANTVKESERDKLSKLMDNLKARVYGQDEALEILTSSIYVSRAGLREEGKPLGCYLFPGPTGSGKTETAKTLADTLGVPLIRFDMSEYMEKHSVSKLIGSPPGYVGYADGGAGAGLLINNIEENPSCVLLLDELEKAHPDVFNILLQVMDNGKLTSSSGKTVDFSNVTLIMTSNAGAADMEKKSIGFGKSDNSSAGDEAIKKLFSPEFRNRLDGEVRFKKLGQDTMVLVVDKFVGQLQSLAKSKKVTIKVMDDAKAWLAKEGYDELMGARPMTRVIHKQLKEPISREMLFGKLVDGGTVTVDVNTKTNTLRLRYRTKA